MSGAHQRCTSAEVGNAGTCPVLVQDSVHAHLEKPAFPSNFERPKHVGSTSVAPFMTGNIGTCPGMSRTIFMLTAGILHPLACLRVRGTSGACQRHTPAHIGAQRRMSGHIHDNFHVRPGVPLNFLASDKERGRSGVHQQHIGAHRSTSVHLRARRGRFHAQLGNNTFLLPSFRVRGTSAAYEARPGQFSGSPCYSCISLHLSKAKAYREHISAKHRHRPGHIGACPGTSRTFSMLTAGSLHLLACFRARRTSGSDPRDGGGHRCMSAFIRAFPGQFSCSLWESCTSSIFICRGKSGRHQRRRSAHVGACRCTSGASPGPRAPFPNTSILRIPGAKVVKRPREGFPSPYRIPSVSLAWLLALLAAPCPP